MNTEQKLVTKWRNLPPDKQQEVIDFIEFMEFQALQKKSHLENQVIPQKNKSKSDLGQRLKAIREEVVASGVHLLNEAEIEQEKRERQSGYYGD
jgi:hypothetical protein